MNKIITVFLVAMFVIPTAAQEKVAKIEFKSDVIDYGQVENGSDGVRVFEFTNTGDAPLVISRVYSSCGCTIPKKPDAPILPGENGEIQVKYDTKRTGPIRKTITVNSNATEATKALKIKGEVMPPDEDKG
ncbi:MAG: DUF1573 domain-containing protein [Flavobacteriaceae bacterium]|jgi:hypothetical protein|nr:DUF1573 domain-containing protein [Flavobacteriaceae bacterium]